MLHYLRLALPLRAVDDPIAVYIGGHNHKINDDTNLMDTDNIV